MENRERGEVFVFIGEKIHLRELEPLNVDGFMYDAQFKATYRVIEPVCGFYGLDTISFTVYDHYGVPAFSEFPTVLLFLTKHRGTWYHQKYLYHPVYQTENGSWASPYPTSTYWDTSLQKRFPPLKIDFAKEVSFPITGMKKQYVKRWFPEPYYKISGQKAIAVWGNYPHQLLEIAKNSSMDEHWSYKDEEAFEPEIRDVVLEDIEEVRLSEPEEKELINAWKKLFKALETQSELQIKSMSLDSVICSVCEGFAESHFYNDVEPIDSFISSSFRNFPTSYVWPVLKTEEFTISATKYPDRKILCTLSGDNPVIYEVSFETLFVDEYSKILQIHTFQFVKVKGIFKFYGMHS